MLLDIPGDTPEILNAHIMESPTFKAISSPDLRLLDRRKETQRNCSCNVEIFIPFHSLLDRD
jgi:hypothetical protein